MPGVVVTGLGATTPLGGDVAGTWGAMLAGESGVRRLDEEWAAEAPVRIAARLKVEPTTVLDRVAARRMDRCQQVAVVAAREAWRDAGAPDVVAGGPRRVPVPVALTNAFGFGGHNASLVFTRPGG